MFKKRAVNKYVVVNSQITIQNIHYYYVNAAALLESKSDTMYVRAYVRYT